MNFTEWPK